MKKTNTIHAALLAAIATTFIAAATLAACSNSSDSPLPLLTGSSGGSPSTNGGTNETGGGGSGGGNENGGQSGGQQAQTKQYSKTLKMGAETNMYTITGEQVGSYEFVSGSDVVNLDNYGHWGTLTTLKVGTAVIKYTGYENGLTYVVTITVESAQSGGSGQTENFESCFYGIWKCAENSVSGTLTLNSDNTGHIVVNISGNGTPHNSDIKWSASKSGGKMYLRLYDFSNSADAQSALNGTHEISTRNGTISNYFNLHGYFGFGLPSETTWNKQ